jgi:hypothetical protein
MRRAKAAPDAPFSRQVTSLAYVPRATARLKHLVFTQNSCSTAGFHYLTDAYRSCNGGAIFIVHGLLQATNATVNPRFTFHCLMSCEWRSSSTTAPHFWAARSTPQGRRPWS